MSTVDKRTYRQCVRIVICKDDKVLLGKKIIHGKFVCYEFPGGGVEEDHDLVQTVIKEALEEVGIRVKNIQSLGLQVCIEMELKKNNRAELFKGSEDNWYTAEYVSKDMSLHGDDKDSFPYSWETVDSAIEKISSEKSSPHTESKLEALKRVKKHLQSKSAGIEAW